jgi:cytochrome c oxidase assembly protein subunit 20
MAEALDLMNQLKAKKQGEKDRAEENAVRLAEEERKKKNWTNPSNYKFW